MIDVGNELALSYYLLLTSGAAFFGLMLCIPTHDHQVSTKFSNSDPEFLIPGFINPVPPLVLPSAVFSKDGGYTSYLKLAKRFGDTKGIIVNTLLELESHAISSFCDDQAPPIYTIGSVIDVKGEAQNKLGSPGSHSKNNNIIKWLDDHGVPVLREQGDIRCTPTQRDSSSAGAQWAWVLAVHSSTTNDNNTRKG
ncbi:hypothetical protein CsSME_00001416 [Camellia sinensis var. sinensis]|uniref:Uncharacterized protein n=1 Tax=Camellia sinensis TaxID=4442 RepID=A0A7J7I6R0_CAMSI|nr:hypothetical protein HYC85_001027 [Camellia sinensis]